MNIKARFRALDISESPEYQQIKHENAILQAETAKHVVERSELQYLRERLENERADRNEYEKHVEGLIELAVQEKMNKMNQVFDEMVERMKQSSKFRIKPEDVEW